MTQSSTGIPALLAIITVIVGFAALKVTQPITLPLAFAVVVVLFFRPLQKWLDARLPHWLSPLLIILIVLSFLALGVLAVTYAVSVVAPELPRYAEQLQPRLETLRSRLQGVGLSLPGGSSSGFAQVASGALSGVGALASALGVAILTLTVLVFLLAEVGGFRQKLAQRTFSPPNNEKVRDAFSRMAGKFARYFLVQAFSSVVTGILTGLYCWLVGVEFPFVWGLLTAVLNFVPTIGSIVAGASYPVRARFRWPRHRRSGVAGNRCHPVRDGQCGRPGLAGKCPQAFGNGGAALGGLLGLVVGYRRGVYRGAAHHRRRAALRGVRRHTPVRPVFEQA